MFPSFTVENVSYGCGGYSVFDCKNTGLYFSFAVVLANLFYGIGCKFCFPLNFSSCLSKFIKHVTDIIACISKKEMIWFYTQPVITFVKYLVSIGNSSVMQHPRKSMGGVCFSVEDSSKTSISSIYKNSTRPIPTSICFINSLPKIMFKFFKIVVQDRFNTVLHWDSFLGAIFPHKRVVVK